MILRTNFLPLFSTICHIIYIFVVKIQKFYIISHTNRHFFDL